MFLLFTIFLPRCRGILASTLIQLLPTVGEGVGTLIPVIIPVATVCVGQVVEVTVSAGGAPG